MKQVHNLQYKSNKWAAAKSLWEWEVTRLLVSTADRSLIVVAGSAAGNGAFFIEGFGGSVESFRHRRRVPGRKRGPAPFTVRTDSEPVPPEEYTRKIYERMCIYSIAILRFAPCKTPRQEQ